MSQTLSVLSHDPETTRRPSGNTATQLTYDEARSSQKYSGRRNARSPSALSASVRRIRIYGIQNNALTCSSSTCRASLWRRLPARRVHRLCHCCRLWIDYSSCPLSLSIRYRHVTRHGSCSFGQPSGQSYVGRQPMGPAERHAKICWSCGAPRHAQPPAIIDAFQWPRYHLEDQSSTVRCGVHCTFVMIWLRRRSFALLSHRTGGASYLGRTTRRSRCGTWRPANAWRR